jgi:hypothetical protein
MARQGAGAEPDKYVNPYKGGASALDKAAELFFFTEILRGTVLYFADIPRNVFQKRKG